jgi:hypothetical protein
MIPSARTRGLEEDVMPGDSKAGVCPRDGYVEEEPFDYGISGQDLFQCGQCGIIFSQDEEGTATIIEDSGF